MEVHILTAIYGGFICQSSKSLKKLNFYWITTSLVRENAIWIDFSVFWFVLKGFSS